MSASRWNTAPQLTGTCVCGKPTSWHRTAINRSVRCEDAQPVTLHDRLAYALQQRASARPR